jgi:hypothetical protein
MLGFEFLAPPTKVYSPECVEGEFSEVRMTHRVCWDAIEDGESRLNERRIGCPRVSMALTPRRLRCHPYR